LTQLLFANNANSTLAGALTNTTTTINLQAGTGVLFPNPTGGQAFKLTLLDAATKTLTEIVLCTARSTDTLTVVRAQEGTTGLAWNAGDLIANDLTAGTMQALAQTATISGSYYQGTDTGSANAVQVATLTPTLTTPVAGQVFLITKGTASNTGAVTMQIAGGATISVVYEDGSPLNAGDWAANAAAQLYYTGGVFQFLACEVNPAVRTFFATDSGTADALVSTPVPAVPALNTNVSLRIIKGASPNATTTPTINVSGLGAKTITRFDGSACVAGDLPANALIPLQYDGTNMRLAWPATPAQIKIKLSGNLTIYIRTDGNDSNNGLINSPSGAFLTIQGAWNAIFNLYDFSGFTITFQLGIAGTYAGATFSGYSGNVVLNGNSGSPTTYIVNCPAATPNVINNQITTLQITNLMLDYTYNSTPTTETTIDNSGQLIVGPGVTYRCLNNRANLVENYSVGTGANITFANSSTTNVIGSGSRNSFANTFAGGEISAGNAPVNVYFTSTGTIAYTTFAIADLLSLQSWAEAIFTGFTASGSRYYSNRNSVIGLSGVTLPGSTAGSTANGGLAV